MHVNPVKSAEVTERNDLKIFSQFDFLFYFSKLVFSLKVQGNERKIGSLRFLETQLNEKS